MTKNLKIALSIFILLLGLFFINNNLQSRLESNYEPIFNDDIKDIFKFLIQNGENAIELSKKHTIWTISGNDTLVIKQRSINNLFDKVLKVNKGTVISENPEKYNKYSVDDSTGTHLAVINSKGNTLEHFIFGRSKSDYSRSYLRINDDPKVYLANQNVIYMLSTDENYWGEKPKEEIALPDSIPVIN